MALTSAAGFRLSSFALAAALVFALAGLFAVDRTLAESTRTQVQIEAAESGALVEGFLAVHAEALQSIRGLYLDTTRGLQGEQFHSLVTSMTQYARAFRRVWVADTSGRVTEQYLFGVLSPPLPIALDIDTVHSWRLGDLARMARRTRRAQVSAPGLLNTGERGVLLLQPIFVGDRFMGVAGGTITEQSLLRGVEERRPRAMARLVLLADRDTVADWRGDTTLKGAMNSASSMVHLPGGGAWRLVVMRRSGYESARVLLWAVGLATLGALIVVMLHEHRQGRRLAERSAELERLSMELLRANRVKSEFLANVSHELRTPLNAIVGFVELLRDGVYGELATRQTAPVERIASSANHLRQLVDQVLDLAKMAAGRFDVHPEPVDLRPFVMTVVSEVESLIAERGLGFSIAVGSTLPRVHTDPMHLRQILVNLLSNAIKFTPNGTIALRARVVDADAARRYWPRLAVPGTGPGGAAERHGSWVAIQVTDSGIGIPAADRERIFEEFEQVNAGPRGDSMQRGTGLGLAISRRLARLLGGDITLESELGRGSTFTLWIPVEGSADATAAPPDDGAPGTATTGGDAEAGSAAAVAAEDRPHA